MTTSVHESIDKHAIAIVIGNALTDIYLVREIIKYYPEATIIKYTFSKIKNLSYYSHKVSNAGVLAAIGIQMLSSYFRLEIQLEKYTKKTIWYKSGIEKPAPHLFNDRIVICNNEDELYKEIKKSRCVILTQGLKLKDRFLRQSPVVLQIIGGKYPEYCGEVALFWAMALGNSEDYYFSIIKRHKYFNHSQLMALCPVEIKKPCSIRLLRLKGIQAIAAIMPNIIANILTEDTIPVSPPLQSPVILSPPTIFTYLKIVLFRKKLNRIPSYAFRSV